MMCLVISFQLTLDRGGEGWCVEWLEEEEERAGRRTVVLLWAMMQDPSTMGTTRPAHL